MYTSCLLICEDQKLPTKGIPGLLAPNQPNQVSSFGLGIGHTDKKKGEALELEIENKSRF